MLLFPKGRPEAHRSCTDEAVHKPPSMPGHHHTLCNQRGFNDAWRTTVSLAKKQPRPHNTVKASGLLCAMSTHISAPEALQAMLRVQAVYSSAGSSPAGLLRSAEGLRHMLRDTDGRRTPHETLRPATLPRREASACALPCGSSLKLAASSMHLPRSTAKCLSCSA